MGALIYQPDAVTRLFPDAPPLQARIQTILKSIYALDAEMNSAFASVLRQGRQVRWSPPLPTPEQIVQEYRLIDEQRAELERKMNDLSFTPDDPHLKPEEFFRREADSIFEALLVIKVNFRTRAGVILSESGITVRNSETGLPKKIPPVPRTEQNMDDQLYAICNPPSSDQAYIREVEHNLANLRARLAPNIKGSVRPTPNRPRRTV